MSFQSFVGIDVSKQTIDVHIHGLNLHKQFTNDRKGFEAFFSWILKNLCIETYSQVLVCFEHTGMYSLPLACYMDEVKIPFFMISALQIKRSLGIKRGKTDKVDARRIAEYAHLYRDTITLTKLPSGAILRLHPLLTLRDRLVRDRAGYEATQREQERFLKEHQLPVLFETYAQVISTLKGEIKKVESAMWEIIAAHEELREMLSLVTTIKGIGPIIGTYLIVYTHNFTRFENWRKFACYAGIAPFENQSGSFKGRTKVSSLANKQVKKLLHMAALRAAHFDKELSIYYHNRINRGKSKLETLNIIRNKIAARVFAVARRKTAYVDILKYAA